MRCALLQLNPWVGAVRSNHRLILDGVRAAADRGAKLVVTPELALCGYPPKDLLDRPAFLDTIERELRSLAEGIDPETTVVVGTVTPRPRGPGKTAWNSAAILRGGRVVGRVHKSLLPTYDVFDEMRHFEPEAPEAVAPIDGLIDGGGPVGITICEDMWNDADFWPRPLYGFDPAEQLVRGGARVLLNLSASPFHRGKARLREAMLGRFARDHAVSVLHVNLVGANDELIFDGRSFVVGPDGAVRARAAAFTEDMLIVDTEDLPLAPAPPADRADEDEVIDALCLGIRDYMHKCGFKDAVIGLSGGIDSAVVAALATRALGPERVTGITMPSRYSSDGSVEDSLALGRHLGIRVHTVPIEGPHAALRKSVDALFLGAGRQPADADLSDQNLQARIRGTILMAWSNRMGAILLSTGNKSEVATGYCTLYGDMAGGLAVISDLPKTLVYRVAERLNKDGERIPMATLTKAPSAELAPGQLDTDSLPPYPVLDAILEAYLEQHLDVDGIVAATGADRSLVVRVVAMVDRNEYKRRQAAPGLRVTTKAFGAGRRLPIAARMEFHDA